MKSSGAALLLALGCWCQSSVSAQIMPAVIEIPNAPVAMRVLVQSPAETATELQAICLFRSSPENVLQGSLAEVNEKLKGLLDRIRKPALFRGDLGETLLIEPPAGSLGARKLLLVGLGDSQTFTPARMDLVGQIVYRVSSDLGIARPCFAPTILDGGVAKFGTGEVAGKVIAGFLRAQAADGVLKEANASGSRPVTGLTYLAGAANANNTRDGIERAIAEASLK